MFPAHARALAVCWLALVLIGAGLPLAAASVASPMSPRTRFFTPSPPAGAKAQELDLLAAGRDADAALIRNLAATPQAVWLTGGSPTTVERATRTVTEKAAKHATVATLVLYNVPGRDCSLYSAGGAADPAAYRAWVDGVAAGLPARGRVLVVVEPDGLALLPSDCPQAFPGQDLAALAEQRIAAIRYAGQQVMRANPDALVYLDAGQSGWHSVGDIASRLDRAGVREFQGFALNVSNFQPTDRLLLYGSWVSRCLHYVANAAEGGWRLGRYDYCASQYYPATADDFSSWQRSEQWYVDNVDQAPGAPTDSSQLAHFVVDTSRNGRGPWTPPTDYPDAQVWCNPPGRGLGRRPTAATGHPLADAFLWVKVPGQSDGQCNRGVAGQTTDPAWGNTLDPPAGAWFEAQALELARLG